MEAVTCWGSGLECRPSPPLLFVENELRGTSEAVSGLSHGDCRKQYCAGSWKLAKRSQDMYHLACLTISQCIRISNQRAVYFKYMQCYLSVMSQ